MIALACLAAMVFTEARGEPLIGQLAVAHVALNRQAQAPDLSLCEIITKPHQFHYQAGGYSWAVAIAATILPDPTDGATFFATTPQPRLTPTITINNHVFMKENP